MYTLLTECVHILYTYICTHYGVINTSWGDTERQHGIMFKYLNVPDLLLLYYLYTYVSVNDQKKYCHNVAFKSCISPLPSTGASISPSL